MFFISSIWMYDICAVYECNTVWINAGSHVIASIKYTIYIWFSCSEEVEKWRKYVSVCALCTAMLNIKYNRNIENCTAKNEVSFKPFSVLFLFIWWVFLWRLFQLVLLKLIPCLPFAIQNSFARHSVNTHECECVCVCAICMCPMSV